MTRTLRALARATAESLAFPIRSGSELSRISRRGGFLSVVALGSIPGLRLFSFALRLRSRTRAHDMVAWRPRGLLVLMPDTDQGQAALAVQRFLNLGPVGMSAGISTTYAEVAGGAPALVEAAWKAQRAAPAGTFATSEDFHGRPRILVIDDDATFAEALCDALRERGWQGEACTSPVEGFSKVQAGGDYAALFVDLVMPGLSGSEILSKSVSLFPARPAVLMSGKDPSGDDSLPALPFGQVMFIRKPVSADDLTLALQMIRSLLPGAPPRRR